MKKLTIAAIALLVLSTSSFAAEPCILPLPSQDRGASVMRSLWERRSHREYSPEQLSGQDLGDLLWAARGVNRDDGRLTSPTAQNSQDVDVYLCTADGVWIYDAAAHSLLPVTSTDIMPLLEGRRPSGAPSILLIVSDMSRYRGYSTEGDTSHFYEMGAVDSGIVSQNIALFCAGVGLATVPRASMDKDGIREALGLSDSQYPWLNHPVGYPAQ